MSDDVRETCAYCPRLCHDVCPAVRVEHRDTPSPTSLMTLLLLQRVGGTVSAAAVAEAVGHCIVCGRCTATCLHHAKPWQEFLNVRRQAHRDGVVISTGSVSGELWAPSPFHRLGGGTDAWLLVGSLSGIAVDDIVWHLGADKLRVWRLPRQGRALLLQRAWARGDESIVGQYARALQSELSTSPVVGIAWADPHEEGAVREVVAQAGWRGPVAYAPHLLGLSDGGCACGDLTLRYGCCGAAGGYPDAAPAAAAELAALCEIPDSTPLPGICVAHLERNGRGSRPTDWSRR